MAKATKQQTSSKAAKTASTNAATVNTTPAQTVAKPATTNAAPTNTATSNTAMPSASETTIEPRKIEPVQTLTTAEKSYKNNKSTYNVKVEKTTSNPNLSEPYYGTTINETAETPTTKFSRTDIKMNTFETTGVIQENSAVYERMDIYHKNGEIKEQTLHDVKQKLRPTSATEIAQGYKGKTVNYTEMTQKNASDSKGRLKSFEVSEVISGRDCSLRTDHKDFFDKGNLKRQLRADNALAQLSLKDIRFKNEKQSDSFSATISKAGEYYVQQKGNHQYSVEVDASGKISGTKNKLNDTKITEMSQKETQRALKNMRQQFSDKMEELNGARTPEEYTKLLPSPLSIGRTEPVNKIFAKETAQERSDAQAIKENIRNEFIERQAADKQVTAEDIATIRLNNLRQNQN